MTEETYAKAIEILEKTNDGDTLDPSHLFVVERVINNYAFAEEVDVFNEIYKDVAAGKYQKPFLFGVEHITIDHSGYIYWKDIIIEHFNFPYLRKKECKKHVLQLAERCKWLESQSLDINLRTVVWEKDSKGGL